MRKSLSALLLILFLLAGCAPKSQPLPENEHYPMDFIFSSGVGAWHTHLVLYSDGTFTGEFSDSEMGEFGANYPNGTVYHCSFQGKFQREEPLDIHSFPLTLTELTATPTPNTEEITDGIRFVGSAPYGLTGESGPSAKFVLYDPTSPILGLDEELLSWWPGRFEESPPDTLSCWALWNTETGAAFFTSLTTTNTTEALP